MYLKFIAYAPCILFLVLIAYILSPFLAAYSVLAGVSVLPYPLNLFHSHDDDLDGGQHQNDWPKVTGLKLIWQRTHWICRNPAYGFKAYWFGIPAKGTLVIHESEEFTRLITIDGMEYFCFKDNRETSMVKWSLGWAWWYDEVYMYKFAVKFGF